MEIGVNAVRASEPIGMGFIQYRKEDDHVTPSEMAPHLSMWGLSIDYFRGRMVKLGIERLANEEWRISLPTRDGLPRPDFQSWCRKYPTVAALIESVVKS